MKWIVDADTMAELQRRNDELRHARAIAAPDSWPWPMSEDARKWVSDVDVWYHNQRVYEQQKRDTALTPEQQADYDKFNRAGHDAFMRGLG